MVSCKSFKQSQKIIIIMKFLNISCLPEKKKNYKWEVSMKKEKKIVNANLRLYLPIMYLCLRENVFILSYYCFIGIIYKFCEYPYIVNDVRHDRNKKAAEPLY